MNKGMRQMKSSEMKLQWPLLLCPERPGTDGEKSVSLAAQSHLERGCFDQDYDRVVFSPPFRRLSKKTQVHPFSNIDFIHNRLTHSVEVASLGWTFGMSLAKFLKSKKHVSDDMPDSDLASILSAACSAHDIGNPPFGHAGEDAIKAWAEKTDWSSLGASNPTDWLYYDGNAQTFRMVSNPSPRDSSYFKLTYATCGSIVKYPWVAGTGLKKDKAGCFSFREESSRFDVVMTNLGLKISEGKYCRHPMSFLLEAADDICYQVMDVEDAVTMHIIEESTIKKLLSKVAGENDDRPIQHLRARVIHKLCESAFDAFVQNYDKIMQGEFEEDLVSCSSLHEEFNELKKQYKQIFSTRSKVASEVSCFEIMDRLLTRYSRFALNMCTAKSLQDVHSADLKLLDFTWGRVYGEKVIKAHVGDMMWWLHAITDHIVGMTDDYARNTAAMF